MEEPVIRRSESHFSADGGLVLFRRSWLPPEPERLLVLVHGWAEHTGRYPHVGSWLAARGSAVEAYDQRGHGQSDGLRSHVRRFDELLDDLDRFVALTRREHPGLPVFVVGHSMGGLVAAAWACQRNPEVRGVVTSGAALDLGTPPPLQVLALRALSRVLPRLRMKRPIRPEALSRDPEVGRRYVADPMVFSHMTLGFAAGMVSAARRTESAGAQVRVPMLLLHGGADPIVAARGSERFHAGLRVDGSDLRIYPELRHEIFNEPEWQQVLGDLLDWVRKREAGAWPGG